MSISKNEILDKAITQQVEYKIFKQKSGMSMTYHGFEFVKNIYPDFYTLKFHDIKPKDIIMIQKVFDTPYYINHMNHTLYHYHELLDTQQVFYRNDIRLLLESFL